MTTSARPAQQLADAFEIVTHNAAQHTHQGAAWRAVRDLLTAPAATFTEPGPNPSYTPPTIDGITLTSDELAALTAWSRSSQQHGGFRVWLEHDTAVEAATRIVADRLRQQAAIEDDLLSRIGCVVETTWWDRPYDERIAAIRGMCDLSTNGLTATDDGDQVRHAELLPTEHIVLTAGLAQVLRGEAPDGNVAAMCVLALARLTGRHDWTDQVDVETQGDGE